MATAAIKADATLKGLLLRSPDKPRAGSSWTGGNNQLPWQEISVFVEGKKQTCCERPKQGRRQNECQLQSFYMCWFSFRGSHNSLFLNVLLLLWLVFGFEIVFIYV